LVELLGEEGEVYFAIVTVLPEVGMVFELIFTWMLEDEYAVVGQDVAAEDDVGELGEVVEGIGGVCKDDVEFFVGPFHEVEYIGADGMEVVDPEVGGRLLDEVDALVVDVDGCHFLGTTGYEFERDGTCASKKIHDGGLFVVDIVVEDVEKAFASHVGGGANGQGCGRIESTAFE